jgi:hypothetical protein
MKIEIKEPFKLIIHQTGEEVEFKEAGIQEIEKIDLRMERIIAQSNGKMVVLEEKKGKKRNA